MILGNFFEKLLARDIRRSKQGGGISQGAYFTKFWTRRWSGKTFTADQWQLSNNPGVGKSAFYSKQKERHSKGERDRVPFSAYTNFYTNF